MQVTAEVAQLSKRAERRVGQESSELNVRAAALKEALWRLEHKPSDAAEALELYSRAAAASPSGSCRTLIRRALLRAEMSADPYGLYRELFVQWVQQPDAACEHSVSLLLNRLAAFKPLPAELEQLQSQPSIVRGGRVRPSARAHEPALVVPPRGGAQSGPLQITGIDVYPSKDSARVVIRLTRPAAFELGRLAADKRHKHLLFVDIEQASYEGERQMQLGGLLQSVRVQDRSGTLRVLLELADAVQERAFYLPEPFRLIVDVTWKQHLGARPREIRRVVLDPGHGGHDPGALGPGGLREKDVTLDIAHRAAPLLAREIGVSTLLTRDGDAYVALDERTAKANAFGADLFLSIHCNASESGRGEGVMTFVLDESRDTAAALIAARENSASAEAATELANVLGRTLDSGTVARSLHLADLLQRSTVASLSPRYAGVRDQGVKRAGFYVLAGARMPAVLYEASFISNPVEERFLNTGDYRQKLADAVVNAVRAYREGF